MATKKQRRKLGVGSGELMAGDYELLGIDMRLPRVAWTPDPKGAPDFPFLPTWQFDKADLFKSFHQKTDFRQARWGTEMDPVNGRNYMPAEEAADLFCAYCEDYPGIDWWTPAITSGGVVIDDPRRGTRLGLVWLVKFLSRVKTAGYADHIKVVAWNLYDTHNNVIGPAGAAPFVREAMETAGVVRKMAITEIGHRGSADTFKAWLEEAIKETDIIHVFAYLGRATGAERDRALALIDDNNQLTERGNKFREVKDNV